MRYAKECTSPGRAEPDPKLFYDSVTDMVRWLGSENRPFAIDLEGQRGIRTKKNDLEKGDDHKDSRMWR